jgi:hypothetical protein
VELLLFKIFRQTGATAQDMDCAPLDTKSGAVRKIYDVWSDDRNARSFFYDIYRSIDCHYKPSPVSNNQVIFNRKNDKTYIFNKPLDASEESAVLDLSRSVGRIVLRVNGGYVQLGTGFVIKDGLVATNCHVIDRNKLIQKRNGAWELIPSQELYIDFGENINEFTGSMMFEIKGIKAYSDTEGLDVVLLSVDTKSKVGSLALPVGVELGDQGTPTAPEAMVLVGDPDLKNPGNLEPNTYGPYQGLGYAKFIVLGAVTGWDDDHNFRTLFHIGSTMTGQSGSVIVDRSTMKVVGIHNCCESGEVDRPGPPNYMDCAKIFPNAETNQGIAITSILKDDKLAPFLR